MEYLNEFAVFRNPIIDEKRGVDQLADPLQISNGTPDIREVPEQINVIEKGSAKAFGNPGKL